MRVRVVVVAAAVKNATRGVDAVAVAEATVAVSVVKATVMRAEVAAVVAVAPGAIEVPLPSLLI